MHGEGGEAQGEASVNPRVRALFGMDMAINPQGLIVEPEVEQLPEPPTVRLVYGVSDEYPPALWELGITGVEAD